MIQKEKNFDIARIDTVKAYEGSYQDVVDQGQMEVEKGYKPEIKPLELPISEYDRIIVMTPTWWYTMAPAVLTFLSVNDFNGKIIVPVQTHGGWPGHVIKDMEKAVNGAKFEKSFAVQFDSTGGDEMVTSEKDILDWIKEL